MGPVAAFKGTMAVMSVSPLIVKEDAFTPLNRTWLTPVNPLPRMLTEFPALFCKGKTEVIETGAVCCTEAVCVPAQPLASVAVRV